MYLGKSSINGGFSIATFDDRRLKDIRRVARFPHGQTHDCYLDSADEHVHSGKRSHNELERSTMLFSRENSRNFDWAISIAS